MFITKEELQTAIYEYQLADITGMDVDDIAVWHAVAAAVSEASSYLNAKYDIRAIFSAEGDDRHPAAGRARQEHRRVVHNQTREHRHHLRPGERVLQSGHSTG